MFSNLINNLLVGIAKICGYSKNKNNDFCLPHSGTGDW